MRQATTAKVCLDPAKSERFSVRFRDRGNLANIGLVRVSRLKYHGKAIPNDSRMRQQRRQQRRRVRRR
jgi:hypothetical protein